MKSEVILAKVMIIIVCVVALSILLMLGITALGKTDNTDVKADVSLCLKEIQSEYAIETPKFIATRLECSEGTSYRACYQIIVYGAENGSLWRFEFVCGVKDGNADAELVLRDAIAGCEDG